MAKLKGEDKVKNKYNNGRLFSFQKRDISKKTLKMLKRGTPVWVPLCPDYTDEGISDGVSSLMQTAMSVAEELQSHHPNISFHFLLADTEGDIMSEFDREVIRVSSHKLSSELESREIKGEVSLFCDLWGDWHIQQYAMEKMIKESNDHELEKFMELFQGKRQARYSLYYAEKGSFLTLKQVQEIQIRHYAQYLLIQDLIREKNQDEWVMMNYLTENLRAVTGHHPFLPQKKKVELIVY